MGPAGPLAHSYSSGAEAGAAAPEGLLLSSATSAFLSFIWPLVYALGHLLMPREGDRAPDIAPSCPASMVTLTEQQLCA